MFLITYTNYDPYFNNMYINLITCLYFRLQQEIQPIKQQFEINLQNNEVIRMPKIEYNTSFFKQVNSQMKQKYDISFIGNLIL